MNARTPVLLVLSAALAAGCSAGAEPDTVGAAPSPATIGSTEPSAVPALSPAPAVRTIDVRVAGGAVTGTDGREEVALGEQVVIRLTSDVAESYHVHGYDLQADLPAGQTVEVPLTAGIPGVFEVELHDSGKLLFQLRVA